ncbi:DUF4395 domain-containing protein [Nocardioides sp. R-C-SC26]|uniref:DUF4395 domain-containing protein n=1 Tax=Nocardioides sp. R-C-SC26 TaxID=2870414 RepID=UPI001E42F94A|nr:DUF4395 domain-containing protein [Nocardioides sp. R-C-SC26]
MSTPSVAGIDPRGPRFTAAVTSAVLAAVLLLAPRPAAVVLLAVQTGLFAWGAALGVQRTPLAWLFRTVVRPRLDGPAVLEHPTPPRFAQVVGLAFAVVGLVGFSIGADALGFVAVGMALAAALLNAVTGFCLGCEMYLLALRLRRRHPPAVASAQTPATATSTTGDPAEHVQTTVS